MERMIKILILAFGAILLPQIALADPITVAVVAGASAGWAAAGATIAGITITTLGAVAIGMGVAAMTYVSMKNAYSMGDLGNTGAFADAAAGRTQMVRQAITPRRIIYGISKVSGPIIFIHTTDNENILHMIVAVAGHEVDGFSQFFVEDEDVGFDADPEQGLATCNTGTYNGKIKIHAFRGTDGQQAVPNLIAEAGDKWTSAHRLRGTAYFYARLEYDREVFPNGIPQIRVIVRGKKIFDPRTSTTVWTDNAALCLRDFLTDSKYGFGATSSEIDDTSFISAANICDEIADTTSQNTATTAPNVNPDADSITVTASQMVLRNGERVVLGSDTGNMPIGLSNGGTYYVWADGESYFRPCTSLANARARTAVDITGTGAGTYNILNVTRTGEPRYTINGTIDTQNLPKKTVSEMLACQASTLSYRGGKFKIIPASYPTPTLTFDENDVTGPINVSPKTSRRDRFNAMKGTIVSPENNWQPTDFPAVVSSAFATLDGQSINRDIALPFTISPAMAQRISKIHLLDSRQELSLTVPMTLAALQCEIGDVIYFKNERFGFDETSQTVTSVDTANDTITFASGSVFKLGDIVQISSTGTIPTGLAASTDYRVIRTGTAETIKLATTFQNALDGTAIDITSAGSGTITLTRPTKAFRVVDWQLVPQNINDAPYLGVQLQLKEADASVYDWLTSEETLIDPSPNTTLPSAFTQQPPRALTLTSGTNQLGVAGDGTIISRILASWTQPTDNFARFYELGYKKSSESDYSTTTLSTATTQYYISPVEDGVNYDVRVRAINSLGVGSSYTSVNNHTVVGKSEPPPDVLDFSVERLPDGTRRFTFSTSNFPADVKAGGGVLIKYSTNLSDTWDNMTKLRDTFRASPYETNDLNAGTYLFAIKMIDSTGNESANARFITSTLGTPRIRDALLYRIEEDNLWNGTITDGWITPENTIEATDTDTWADLPSTWAGLPDTWAEVGTPSNPVVYETPVIDLGADVSFTVIASAAGSGTPTFTMKTGTSADGSVTGSYSALGNVTGKRYLQVKLSMAGSAVYITGMIVIADGEAVIQEYQDINLASYSDVNFNKIATGHFQIAHANGAASITQAQITAIQGSTALIHTVVNKTSTVNSNPAAEFKVFDTSGTLTDATVDISLKGPKAS